jgi:hypothetical protein
LTLRSKLASLRVRALKQMLDVPFYVGVVVLVSDSFRYDPYFLMDAILVLSLFLTTIGLQEVLKWQVKRGRA